ncbi:MAG: hypothetical protein U9P10_15450 [Thermodesulfobacteriota bacterium]|nr:hypothetical protein [Thermodesulfobacteriota bacterium]
MSQAELIYEVSKQLPVPAQQHNVQKPASALHWVVKKIRYPAKDFFQKFVIFYLLKIHLF